MLQTNSPLELLVSSTAASPLHNLWSIVLSKVGGAHIEPGDNLIITNNEVGQAPRAGGKATAKGDAKADLNDVKGVVRAFENELKLGRHVRRKSAVEHFPIPHHLSATKAYFIVKLGIPSRSLEPLSVHLGIGKGAAAGVLGMDRVTANRKVAKDDVLPTYAAESMLRLLELDAMARDTFETTEEAAAWLRQAHPMLDGEKPLDCAKSGFGAERVKDILNALKYGGVV
jgi:putative toxin-antitoxin system antitoxin component (TIGR02293 family)